MSAIPRLYFGSDSEAILLRVGDGYDDDGEAYEMLAVSRVVYPAGPGGECAFFLLYVTTLHYDDDVSVWITPIVNGEDQLTQRLDLTGVMDSTGERQTHELGLAIPLLNEAGEEVLRYAPRGNAFSVRVETKYDDAETGAAAAAAKQIVESVEVEYEVVRESMSTQAPST